VLPGHRALSHALKLGSSRDHSPPPVGTAARRRAPPRGVDVKQPLRGPPPGAGEPVRGSSGSRRVRRPGPGTSGDRSPRLHGWETPSRVPARLGRAQDAKSRIPGICRRPTSPPRGVLHQPLAAGPCPRPGVPGVPGGRFSRRGPVRASVPEIPLLGVHPSFPETPGQGPGARG